MKINLCLKGKNIQAQVVLNINPRARGISLRPYPSKNEIRVSMPNKSFEMDALKFLEKKKKWIERQFERHQSKRPLIPICAPDQEITFLGQTLLLKQNPSRGGVFMEGKTLNVSGEVAHFDRRAKDFLKKELQITLEKKVALSATKIGKKFAHVSVKNLSSRWGSCSSSGNLSFAFVIGFAPDFVIDYIVAHEVAHLKEMNHSKAFWAVVGDLYDGDIDRARAWLRVHSISI